MKKQVVVGVAVALVCLVALWSKVGRSKVERPGQTTNDWERGATNLTEENPVAVLIDRASESSSSVQYVDALSAPVQALLGLDDQEHNYATLLAEIHQLGKDLSEENTAALMDMLAWANDRFPEGMRPIEINAIKNDVLDKLLRQAELPEGLGLHMVEMAQNAENDPVWRDYCIQFMDPLYERLTTEYTKGSKKGSLTTEGTEAHGGRASAGGEESRESVQSVDEMKAVREAMFGALDEREHTLAGTALIGLENLSRTHGEFDKGLIAEKAMAIASDEMVSTESRLTALRLSASGDLKLETGNLNEQVAQAARGLAQTGETVLMRSAAIVTLGEVGSEEDRELIESFALDTDRQIAAAAEMALTKMEQRSL